MEIRQMIYFTELARQLNLQSAAQTLYITPQALSKSMRSIVDEYETEIFFRNNGRLQLTNFGQLLYQEISKLLEMINHTQKYIKDLAQQENGLIKISCAHGIMQGDFASLLTQFNNKYPTTRLDYSELPDIFAEQFVEQENCDIGLVINEPQKNELFESRFLKHYQMCAVMRTDNPLANETSLTLKQVAEQPIITKNSIYKMYSVMENLANRQKLHLNYALSSSNEIAWKQMVEDGDGIGIGTSYYKKYKQSKNLCSIPIIDEELHWDIYLIWRKNHYLSNNTIKLIEFLLTECSSDSSK